MRLATCMTKLRSLRSGSGTRISDQQEGEPVSWPPSAGAGSGGSGKESPSPCRFQQDRAHSLRRSTARRQRAPCATAASDSGTAARARAAGSRHCHAGEQHRRHRGGDRWSGRGLEGLLADDEQPRQELPVHDLRDVKQAIAGLSGYAATSGSKRPDATVRDRRRTRGDMKILRAGRQWVRRKSGH